MVAGSLGLARWEASRCGPLTEDNVAIAYLALCRAVTTYKPGAGMTWQSYARMRVRGDLLDTWKLAGGYRRKPRPGETDIYTDRSGEWRIRNITAAHASQGPGPEAVDDRLLAVSLFEAFDDRAQEYLRRWCEGETKAQIAITEGVSERRIGQIINARLEQLRNFW